MEDSAETLEIGSRTKAASTCVYDKTQPVGRRARISDETIMEARAIAIPRRIRMFAILANPNASQVREMADHGLVKFDDMGWHHTTFARQVIGLMKDGKVTDQ